MFSNVETPIIIGVTVSTILAVSLFVVIIIVVIRVRRRQSTRPVTTTTTTATAQVSAAQQAQAQSVSFVLSGYMNVTYPSLHFNSHELGAPPSYEAVMGYRDNSQTMNFGEMG